MVCVLIDLNLFDPQPLIADMPECLSIRSHTTRLSACQHLAAIMRIVLTAKTIMCFPDHFAVRIEVSVSVSRLVFPLGEYSSLLYQNIFHQRNRGGRRHREIRENVSEEDADVTPCPQIIIEQFTYYVYRSYCMYQCSADMSVAKLTVAKLTVNSVFLIYLFASDC